MFRLMSVIRNRWFAPIVPIDDYELGIVTLEMLGIPTDTNDL